MNDNQKRARLPWSARFIIRACNSHYELVEALESVWADWGNSNNANDPDANGYETLQKVKAALIAAGVKL